MPVRTINPPTMQTGWVIDEIIQEMPPQPALDLQLPDPTNENEVRAHRYIMDSGLDCARFRNYADLMVAGYDETLGYGPDTCNCEDCRNQRRFDRLHLAIQEGKVSEQYRFITLFGNLMGGYHLANPDIWPKADLRYEWKPQYRITCIEQTTPPNTDDGGVQEFHKVGECTLRYLTDLMFKSCSRCNRKVMDIITNCGMYRPNFWAFNDGSVMCPECFNDRYMRCASCEHIFPFHDSNDEDVFVENGDSHICRFCDEEYFETCGLCDERRHREDMEWVEDRDEYLCDSCFSDRYYNCAHCGTRRDDDDDCLDTQEGRVCQDCADEHYQECPACGNYGRTDRGRITQYDGTEQWLCRACTGDTEVTIRNHSYKPRPRFMKLRREPSESASPGEVLYFGFELEVENVEQNISCEDMCVALDQLFTENKLAHFAYFKHDGSLNCGFEVVSHPMSWDWFLSNRQFLAKMLALLREKGFRSWNTRSCGLHIHLNKTALNGQRLYKFMKFFHENGSFLYTISCRRSREEMNQWARIDERGASKSNLAYEAKNKMKRECGRYWAVNLEPPNTVEVRLFKGTLNEASFMRAFEFLRSVYLFCANGVVSVNKVNISNYLGFVRTLDDNDFASLKNTLTNRGFSPGASYKDKQGD